MTVDLTSKEGLIIRKLIPLATLPSASLKAICTNMVVEEIKDGFLFKKGDTDDRLVYLLSGTVSLQAQGLIIDSIDAKNDAARFALAHQIPRKIDALAKGVVRFLRMEADIINNPPQLVYQEDNGYVVHEEDEESGSEDWMAALLKSPVFQNLAPANLQKILISLESVHFSKGSTILEQGNLDDYYHLIKVGTCLLTHKSSADGKETKLAQVSKGNTLGEDALIFDAPRTETITALTDVVLLRLDKQKFIHLIKEPSLNFVDFIEMQEVLMAGATMLDIRPQNEFKERHLNGSINIPFFSLRTRFKMLPIENPVIVISNSDKTSEAAAFFLVKHRYQTFILKGGISAIGIAPENENIFFKRVHSSQKAPNTSDWQSQSGSEEPSYTIPPSNEHEARIADLEAENEMLRKSYAELNRQYAQMRVDRDNAEKQNRILSKQIEKLTLVLNKFKLSKAKPGAD